MPNRDHNRQTALANLLDLLIPGDIRWPSATAAGVDVADIESGVAPDTFDWIDGVAHVVASLARSERSLHLARVEHVEPERFRRMLSAVHRAYYTTVVVQAIVADLANSAPREASPYFDDSLVARVILTQAGRRRM